MWDTQKRRFISSFIGHNNWIRCAKFSNDGKIIASCSDDRTIRIWDAQSGQCVHTFPTIKGKLNSSVGSFNFVIFIGSGNSLSIHSNGTSVAVAMSSGSVRIYDIKASKLQQHYILHDNTKSVAWHPLVNYLLTCGNDGTMRIVDVMEGRPLYTLEGHEGSVESVTFSDDGDYFASGGHDRLLKVLIIND